MPNELEPDKPASEKQDWQLAVKWINTSGFRVLLIAAGLLTVGLILFVTLAIRDTSTQANVFIAGILTILTIVVTTISAVSNRLMVEVMERQETEMTNARVTAQEQRDAMREQLVEMKAQVDLMEDSIAATDEIIKQNEQHFRLSERPILVIDKVTADVVPGRPIAPIFITVANKGKSPAINIFLAFNLVRPPKSIGFEMNSATLMEAPMLTARKPTTLSLTMSGSSALSR
jgi:hypothetical protein